MIARNDINKVGDYGWPDMNNLFPLLNRVLAHPVVHLLEAISKRLEGGHGPHVAGHGFPMVD